MFLHTLLALFNPEFIGVQVYRALSVAHRRWYLAAVVLMSMPHSLTFGQGKTLDFVKGITQYRAELKREQDPVGRTKLFFFLANNYSVTNEDSAAFFAQQGIKLAERLPDKHLLILLYGELGRSYESSGKTDEALRTLQRAEQLSYQYANDSTTALIQLMLANFYTKRGNDSQALPKALSALRNLETYYPDKRVSLCKLYNTLGIIYSNQKKFEQALLYFEKQKAIGATVLSGFYVYLSSINISDIYLELNQLDKAESYARQALAKAKELNSKRGIGFGYGQLAEIMYKAGRYDDAIDYAQQALQIRQQLTDIRLVGLSLISLGEIYAARKEYPRALEYADKGATILRGTSDRISTRKALELKAAMLERTDAFREALAAYKEAHVLSDSLQNAENAKEVSRIQGSFDLERKQNQIQLLNKNLAIQQLEGVQRQRQMQLLQQDKRATDLRNQLLTKKEQLNRSQLALQAIASKRQQSLITQQQTELNYAQRQRLLYLTILLLLLGFIGAIGYFLNRQLSAKRLLSSQKQQIEEQAGRLAELNATKDKLFSIIGHDLRSPVARMKHNVQQIREVNRDPAQLLPLMARLETQVDNVLTLLTNLLDWSMIQLKGFQSDMRPIRLRDTADEVVSQLNDSVRQKDLTFIDQIDAAHWVMADKHQLQAIFRNVLSNAVKFTPTGGYIRIYSVRKEEQVELIIRDSGMGMTAEQRAALFSAPQVRSGTQGEKGVGLGLRICREMVDRQGGSLCIDNPARGGTVVRIRLGTPAEQPTSV